MSIYKARFSHSANHVCKTSSKNSEKLPRFVLLTFLGVATVVVMTSVFKVTQGPVGGGGGPNLEKKRRSLVF